MNKILIILSCITLFSCGKKSGTPATPPSSTGSIQYKVNGNLVSADNSNTVNGAGVVFAKQLKGTIVPATRYLLNAQKDANNSILTSIVTDSLLEINYHYDSAYYSNNSTVFQFTLDFNGQSGSLFFNGDFFDITISSYKNSRITGTFTAKLSPSAFGSSDYNNRGSLIITEGVLDNVPVTY